MSVNSAYRRPRLADASTPGQAAVVPMQLQELDCLSSVRIYIPKDLRPPDARQMALKVRSIWSSPDQSSCKWQLNHKGLTKCATCKWKAQACRFQFYAYQRMIEVPCMQAVAEVQRRYPEGVPLLSPEEDMSIKDSAFRKAQRCGLGVSNP